MGEGRHIRLRILQYLRDWGHSRESVIPNLRQITEQLGLSEEDVDDQLDILESQGAIKVTRTFTDVAPLITGTGKALLEDADEAGEIMKKGAIMSDEATIGEQPLDEFEWDAFISHASEDKDVFVRDLAERLQVLEIHVWYDEFTLKVGDSLRQSIDMGLARSRYGIVVLSHSFFSKEWPQKELDGLVAREYNGNKVILPVWLDVEASDVTKYSPLLAGVVAAKAADGIDAVVTQLRGVIRPDIGYQTLQSSGQIVKN